MKIIIQFIAFCSFCMTTAQINISDGGIVRVGQNEASFVDSGGTQGNYRSNENYQITICPNSIGNYVQLEFLSFETENLLTDLMTIYNGKNTNGSIIASFGGDLEAIPQELFPVVPWGNYIASTDPSGCITIKFDSDNSISKPGWEAIVNSTPSFGGNNFNRLPPPDNSVCGGAGAFCADAGVLEFENVNEEDGVPNAGSEITDNTCLDQAPRPAWYFVEIGKAGLIEFEIAQTTGPGGTGTGLDVDFVLWGPFSNPSDACIDFTLGDCNKSVEHDCTGTAIDCSYSPEDVETATIPNAQIGEFYMFLITNFDGPAGYITLSQTNDSSLPGNGSTDCCPFEEAVNPSSCNATDGEIQISLLSPNTNYTINYIDPTGTPQSVPATSNASGQIVITGLGVGTYTDIDAGVPGCTPDTIVLSAGAPPSVTNLSSNGPICLGDDAVFTIQGTPGSTVNYTTTSGGAQTTVLNGLGSAIITSVAFTADETIVLNQISFAGCDATLTDTITVTIIPVASADASIRTSPICEGETAIFDIVGTPNATVTYNLGAGNLTTTLDTSGNATVNVPGATSVNEIINLVSVATTTPAVTGNVATASGGQNSVNATDGILLTGSILNIGNSSRINNANQTDRKSVV